uniref:Shisa N-terminal domain-containing protein n=1 Tax=Oreochromis aureus TaxID=47969 RepID=A0A668RUS6_OREAU
MSSDCESYYTEENVLVENFTCPKADGDTTALYCCGFSDLKYCCADPNSFFPYEYGYMWWLSVNVQI